MESSNNNNNNRPPSCGTWVPSSTAPLGKVLSSALSSAWLQDKELVPVTFQTSQLGILEMPHCAQRAETFLPVSLHLGGSGQQEGTCSPSRQGRGSATLPPSRQRTKRGLPGPGREAAGGRGGGVSPEIWLHNQSRPSRETHPRRSRSWVQRSRFFCPFEVPT